MYYTIHQNYTGRKHLGNKMLKMTNSTALVKIRDLPPTAVRLKPELRQRLAREAAINGRSLHGEILFRLTTSLEGPQGGVNTQAPHRAGEAVAGWLPQQSDGERAMLTLFRALPPEKQLALLSLFR